MNIRPYMDALRKTYGRWHRRQESQFGGERVVQTYLHFRGKEPVTSGAAKAGDRYVRVQMWERGDYSTDHMLVTRDGPVYEQGPGFMRGTTYPTPFKTPADMLVAIETELTRTDHQP